MREQIKPVGKISISKQGKAHIPDLIRNTIGEKEVSYLINAKTVILFDPSASPEEVLKSLDIMRRDIELRIVQGGRKR